MTAAAENRRATAEDFLFEIGTEELPAAAARSAAGQAKTLAIQSFERHHVIADPEKISIWVTPRRIAIFIGDLAPMQQTREIAERGPIAARAFDEEGKPTPAAQGFARARGVGVDELEVDCPLQLGGIQADDSCDVHPVARSHNVRDVVFGPNLYPAGLVPSFKNLEGLLNLKPLGVDELGELWHEPEVLSSAAALALEGL